MTARAELKHTLRAHCAARRAAAVHSGAATAVCAHVLAAIDVAPGAVVSGYWPLRDEMDARPLMSALHARGHALCLPAVMARGHALVFRAWAPGAALVAAGFGLSEPPPDAPTCTPTVVLAPLLGFDRHGYRLGYGAGYYDITLAALRAADPALLAVGLAFAAQEIEAVPAEPWDQRLDWVVTEAGAHRCSGAQAHA